MEQAIVYIGIDVAKAHLDVSWAGEACGFSNERSGHAALVRWLKTSQTPVQLICEARCKPYVCVSMRVQLASWPKARPAQSPASRCARGPGAV